MHRLRWFSLVNSEVVTDRAEAAECPPIDASADEVTAELARLLSDPDETVRLCAAETLGRFSSPETRTALRAFIASEKDHLTKAYGLSSLGMVGLVEDLPLLIDYANADSPQIRIHACVAMFRLVQRVAAAQLSALLETDDVRGAALGALVELLSPPDGIIRLLETIQSTENRQDIADDAAAIVARVRCLKSCLEI